MDYITIGRVWENKGDKSFAEKISNNLSYFCVKNISAKYYEKILTKQFTDKVRYY